MPGSAGSGGELQTSPEIEDGWLAGARRCPSPHADERPADCPVSLLVVHNISLPPGRFGGDCVERLFLGTLDPLEHPYFESLRGLRVSAHLFIDRDGAITQFVAFGRRAWHAGASCFGGRQNCNDFSVGIELEGTDDEAYTGFQYDALARAAVALMRAYPALTDAHIVGHADIAPGRKTDPGPAFDWQRFGRVLQREAGSRTPKGEQQA